MPGDGDAVAADVPMKHWKNPGASLQIFQTPPVRLI